MATLQLNGKTLATQASSAEPVLPSTITGSPALTLTNAIAGTGAIGQATAKAWVNFQGTSTVAIRSSFNVSSITDENRGQYLVNFSSSMPNALYCAVASTGGGSSDAGGYGKNTVAIPDEGGTYTASAIRVETNVNFGSLVDVGVVSVAIFGG